MTAVHPKRNLAPWWLFRSLATAPTGPAGPSAAAVRAGFSDSSGPHRERPAIFHFLRAWRVPHRPAWPGPAGSGPGPGRGSAGPVATRDAPLRAPPRAPAPAGTAAAPAA